VFWWPVFSDLPQRLSSAVRLVYLGAAYASSAFLSLALIFSARAFYGFYEAAPRLWGLSPQKDQNLGGILMNGEQLAVFFVAMSYFLLQLLSEDEESQRGARGPVRRAALLAALAVGLLAVSAAQANGDPASDVLITQQVFLPFEAPISKSASDDLTKTVAAANKRGFKIRVAVIAFTGDLGHRSQPLGPPAGLREVPRQRARLRLLEPAADLDAVRLRLLPGQEAQPRRSSG